MSRTSHFYLSGLIILAGLGQTRAQAQALFTIPETSQVTLYSQDLNHEIVVSVALPRGYGESEQSYPTVYLVDSNLMFGTVTESVRAMNITGDIPPVIVVGIGYTSGRFWNTLGIRALDLTPTKDAEWEDEQARLYPEMPTPIGSGGAPGLAAFVFGEVIPHVEREYRADPSERILLGHSFGGLFALYTLFNHPGEFHRYLVSSPSLWWDSGTLFHDAETFINRHDRTKASVFLSVGTEEPSEFSMVSNVAKLAELLKMGKSDDFQLEVQMVEGAGHNAVIPIAVSLALRSAFRK